MTVRCPTCKQAMQPQGDYASPDGLRRYWCGTERCFVRWWTPNGRVPDPRSDLMDDSALWSELLTQAYALDGQTPDGLYGVLYGLRSFGARLEPAARGGVRLLEGKMTKEEYANYRATYLVPHAAKVTALLSALHAPVRRNSSMSLLEAGSYCQE